MTSASSLLTLGVRATPQGQRGFVMSATKLQVMPCLEQREVFLIWLPGLHKCCHSPSGTRSSKQIRAGSRLSTAAGGGKNIAEYCCLAHHPAHRALTTNRLRGSAPRGSTEKETTSTQGNVTALDACSVSSLPLEFDTPKGMAKTCGTPVWSPSH